MTTVSWLRGASPEPRYIGIGDQPGRLYPWLGYLQGVRGLAERAVLRLPPRLLDAAPPPADVAQIVDESLAGRPDPHSALLLYTAYYKETAFVGPVRMTPTDRPVFWKSFSGPEPAAAEIRRSSALREVLPDGAVTAGCRVVGSRLVEYDGLQRARRRATTAELVRCARMLGRLARDASAVGENIGAQTPKVDVLTQYADSATDLPVPLHRRARDDLEALSREDLFLSHGDFTGRNVFRTTAGTLAVVDYDAVGLRPAHFDVVHLVTQAAVDKGIVPSMSRLRRVTLGLVEGDGRRDLAACLLWDAYETMQQYVDNPANRQRTGPAVALRLAAWKECIG